MGAMMWVNAHTTGKPLLFGYQVLWGRSHDLGFHQAPWGMAHTPARGAELINLYFLRLQTYLFESSVPSLVPFLGALYLTRRVDRFDRYMLATAVLLLGLYFAYWHDGFIFGPRFVFPLVPMLALWTARFPALIQERFGRGFGYRLTWYSIGVGCVLAGTVSIPARVREYAHSFVPMRLDYVAPARTARVDSALIFVRESWGTQLMARMWALGVPRSETELLYGRVDACVLDQHIGALERSAVRDTAALAALTPLLERFIASGEVAVLAGRHRAVPPRISIRADMRGSTRRGSPWIHVACTTAVRRLGKQHLRARHARAKSCAPASVSESPGLFASAADQRDRDEARVIPAAT